MKISNSTYKALQNDITIFITNIGHKAIAEYRESLKDDKRVKDIKTRLCWDIYWKSVSRETKELIRSENLLDNHLQTAIFKACLYNEIN